MHYVVEEAFYVRIDDVACLSVLDQSRQRFQRPVAVAVWPESVHRAAELRLVYRHQHPAECGLHELVLVCGYP